MKAKIIRSVTGFNTNNWIPEGEIVWCEEIPTKPQYMAVEYEERILIIPKDAVEVLND